jgi:NADPH:quinone reductase-like Zn-dependent oxidoreductase
VGPGVTRFKVGDRVLGVTAGAATGKNAERAYQEYVILEEGLTAPIPEGIAYERAAVVPLGVTTAAAGLFLEETLGLRLPVKQTEENKEHSRSEGEVVLVLGGASSVGISTVQLAVAAGYEVIATSSPHSSEIVTRLGATKVFDYHSQGVVDDLVEFTRGKRVVGVLDAVGAQAQAIEFVQKAEGRKLVLTSIPFEEPPEGVTLKLIPALSIRGTEVGRAIWETYLPQAFADGRYVPAPEPVVVGKGVEAIQRAVDFKAEGGAQNVGKKVVVTLD